MPSVSSFAICRVSSGWGLSWLSTTTFHLKPLWSSVRTSYSGRLFAVFLFILSSICPVIFKFSRPIFMIMGPRNVLFVSIFLSISFFFLLKLSVRVILCIFLLNYIYVASSLLYLLEDSTAFTAT